jgi:hypothetical protein
MTKSLWNFIHFYEKILINSILIFFFLVLKYLVTYQNFLLTIKTPKQKILTFFYIQCEREKGSMVGSLII